MNNIKLTKLLWPGIIVFVILVGYFGIIVARGYPDVSPGIVFPPAGWSWRDKILRDTHNHYDLLNIIIFHYQITERTPACHIVTGRTFYGLPLVRAQACDGIIKSLPLFSK